MKPVSHEEFVNEQVQDYLSDNKAKLKAGFDQMIREMSIMLMVNAVGDGKLGDQLRDWIDRLREFDKAVDQVL